MIDRLGYALVSVAVALTVVMAIPVWDASAAVPDCVSPPPDSSYQAGGYAPASIAVFGARASIEYNDPTICAGNPSTGTAVVWSMVTAKSATKPGDPLAQMWVQVGYGRFGTGAGWSDAGVLGFDQWTLPCKASRTCAGGYNVSTAFIDENFSSTANFNYSEYYDFPDGHEDMYLAGDYIGDTNYVLGNYWDSAWQAEFAGETTELQSDIPGSSSDPTAFLFAQEEDANGVQNAVPYITLNQPPYPYDAALYTNQNGNPALKVWTHR